MAAMGEMIGNIAHQWRQPLSIISTASTGVKLQKEMNCLSDTQLTSALDAINNSAQYLSQTIDDFRTFFDPNNNDQNKFDISDTLNKALKLVNAQFTAKNIEIIKDIKSYELLSIENELIQVLINILNNARDVLITKNKLRKLILINTYKKDDVSYIEIIDNAGGIKDDIINRVFEPYFTTKHQSKGTGIGLYMSHDIVKNHLNGDISVENISYPYDDIQYKGAKFTIALAVNE
jgi:signal transduction histidine kinase